jgi:hypothetical protein
MLLLLLIKLILKFKKILKLSKYKLLQNKVSLDLSVYLKINKLKIDILKKWKNH